MITSRRKPRRNTRRTIRHKTRRTSQTKVKNMEFVIKMLKSNKYADIRNVLFNLLLVHYGGRKAFLLESSNFTHSEHNIEEILKIISDTSLHVEKDITGLEDYPRYWVTKEKLDKVPKTDEEIGHLLGMKDPGGDFYDYRKKRLTLTINEEKTGADVTTELLKGDMKDIDNVMFAKNKADSFTTVMTQHHLPYTFVYTLEQDDGTVKRLKELKNENMDYMIEHIHEYKNDLANALLKVDNTHPIITLFHRAVSKNKKLFHHYLPLFVYIYNVFNKDENIDFDKKQSNINKKFIDLIESKYK